MNTTKATNPGSTTATRTHRPPHRAIVACVPIMYGTLLMFHHDENPRIGDNTDVWIGLHLIQLAFIAGIACVLWLLAAPGLGRAAQAARALIVPFLILYTTLDAVLGLAWGLIARDAADLPVADRPAQQRLLDRLLEARPAGYILYFAAGLSLVAVTVTVAVARRANAPRFARWLLIAGSIVFAIGHAPPTGPIGMVLFGLGAGNLLTRTR